MCEPARNVSPLGGPRNSSPVSPPILLPAKPSLGSLASATAEPQNETDTESQTQCQREIERKRKRER